MTHKNTGGPAFPGKVMEPDIGDPDTGEILSFREADHPGMTLRDYFAIHTDISDTKLPNLETASEFLGEPMPDTSDINAYMTFGARLAAKLRYLAADAMIEARNK